MEDRFQRHWDFLSVEDLHKLPIKIIGTGSVGSFTALALVKMGAQQIEVWDGDIISEVNRSNQFVKGSDIGEYKVDALNILLQEFEDVSIKVHPENFSIKEHSKLLSGIVVTALDSMTPRIRIWDAIKNNKDVNLLIDPRMGGKVARVYCVNPNSGGADYEKTLYPDSEASPERCTERTIIYNVLGIASIVCKSIEEHLNNKINKGYEDIFDYETRTFMHNLF